MMTKSYRLALHIFRRDLRLQDNSALYEALNLSESVIPCFIFDTRQVGNNDYKGSSCLQFMSASLNELNTELEKKGSQLFCFDGVAEKIVDELLGKHPIEAVFINRDYTPFSLERDKKIAAICQRNGVAFHVHADALLHEPEQCLKANNEPYTVFTPFFKRSSLLTVGKPQVNRYSNYYQKKMAGSSHATLKELLAINNPDLLVKGGRQEGLLLLKKITKLNDYNEKRNIPSIPGTTHLSAHHKFGTLSIRETHAAVLDAFGPHHTLITELYWRDFFTHIGFHFPHVFGHAFHKKYDALTWRTPGKAFERWCEGKTGFPIVDAGMRELNETGYMHNRVRMITACFLTKDLHIDWRLGEKYFAERLVDYDPAVNNGNWQWAASTGCDAQPYFRIFNPWLQQKRFDPEGEYIKKFVPELATVPAQALHQMADKPLIASIDYPKPMVNHASAAKAAKEMFAKC